MARDGIGPPPGAFFRAARMNLNNLDVLRGRRNASKRAIGGSVRGRERRVSIVGEAQDVDPGLPRNLLERRLTGRGASRKLDFGPYKRDALGTKGSTAERFKSRSAIERRLKSLKVRNHLSRVGKSLAT